MMKYQIPSYLISVLAEVLSETETHASMDSLFMYADAPGDPPDGSKLPKAQAWLRRINKDENVDSLQIIGRLIEGYMDAIDENDFPWESASSIDEYENKNTKKEKILKALNRAGLKYFQGGHLTYGAASPSVSLSELIRKKDYQAINFEFNRALENIESNPREAVSAACNILESVCKTYIEDEKLGLLKNQGLKGVWKIVRDNLGLSPENIEDRDLQEILTGIFAAMSGIGSLRTHGSTAHGAGKRIYRLKPRHARLAVHSAHTLALFILETWGEKSESGRNVA